MSQAKPDPRTDRRLAAARRMRDQLRSAIVHEEFEAGALPGESELMLSFATSRQVVRIALGLLRDEGLVTRVQGTGTFSVASKVRHPFTHLHGPASTTAAVSHRVLQVSVEPAPPRVAARLGQPAGSDCGIVEYLTLLGNEPYYVATAYVPVPLLAILAHAPAVGEWYLLYEQAGIELGTTDQAVEAIVADTMVAALLQVRPGAPLMLFERFIRDRDGRPLEYAVARVRGDRIALMHQFTRQPVARPRPVGPPEAGPSAPSGPSGPSGTDEPDQEQ
jgi:GntR family transcriptional regulator